MSRDVCGCYRFFFGLPQKRLASTLKIIPAKVDMDVARMDMPVMAEGFAEPYWLRYARIDTGISCKEEIFKIKKVHISAEAAVQRLPSLFLVSVERDREA